MVAPFFQQLSADFPSTKFVKVDIDNDTLQQTVMQENISSVPTFILYKDRKMVSRIVGADIQALRRAVEANSK